MISIFTKKILKYILIGMIVMTAARYIPADTLKTQEVIMIGAVSSICYALLDMFSPSIKVNNVSQEEKALK